MDSSEPAMSELTETALPSSNEPTITQAIIESASSVSEIVWGDNTTETQESHSTATHINQENSHGPTMDYGPIARPGGEDLGASSHSDGKKGGLERVDILRFRNSFMEMVEELRLQRVVNSESEGRIEQLLADKHELTHKLDEAVCHSDALTENHTCQIQEIVKKNEEQQQQYKTEKAKTLVSQENREKELRSLKDEMRAIHLTKHVLEKKVQEQERQIQLQTSSRDNYLSKMAQLEEKCASLFKVAEDTKEHLDTLEANVKQARELHRRLEYVNKHQNCELEQVKTKVECYRQELVESRARRVELDSREKDNANNMAVKLKGTEQELKMQVELCKHVQTQLSSLREEYQGVLNQVKEAHTLLERHVERTAKSTENEEELRKKLDDLKSEVEARERKLCTVEDNYGKMKEEYALERDAWNKKMLDTEHRLTTLQLDYKKLQDSYDNLETAKALVQREHEAESEELRLKSIQMEKMVASVQSEDSESCSLRTELGNLQLALDQSEFQLAQCEKTLQEREDLLSKFTSHGNTEGQSVAVHVCMPRASSTGEKASPAPQLSPEVITSSTGEKASPAPQLSPEVITSSNGDETPNLVIQQTPPPVAETPPLAAAEVSPSGPSTKIQGQLTMTSKLNQDKHQTPIAEFCEDVAADMGPPLTKKPKLEGDPPGLEFDGGEASATIVATQVHRDECEGTRSSLQQSEVLETGGDLAAEESERKGHGERQLEEEMVFDRQSSVAKLEIDGGTGVMISSEGGARENLSLALVAPEVGGECCLIAGEGLQVMKGNEGAGDEHASVKEGGAGEEAVKEGGAGEGHAAVKDQEGAGDEDASVKEGGAGEGCPPVKVGEEHVSVKEGGAGPLEVKGGGAGEDCPLFSPEIGLGESMLSTQISRQIERVQVFLKMDRLRRPKPIK